jgi:prepilin-type N-terminal cleavage/methylation domain-containing protein/prepilin-type processing-associated H-X9-DG protein
MSRAHDITNRRNATVLLRAFTLLEVLVVVAVIALLMAILLPSLSNARQQARRVLCQSNLHQLNVGINVYVESQRGRFMPTLANGHIIWGGQEGTGAVPTFRYPNAPRYVNRSLGLDPRIRAGAEVFHCPNDNGYSATGAKTTFEFCGTSYFTNDMLIGQNAASMPKSTMPCYATRQKINSGNMLKNLNRSRISNDSKLVLVGDASWALSYNPTYNPPDPQTNCPSWHNAPRFHNMGFLDGHVAFLEVRKGMYNTPSWTVLPLSELWTDFSACQAEIPCR